MRTLIASILVAAALAAALIGWFSAGWSGVQQREAELLAEPRRIAEGEVRDLAAELVARLEQLRVSEARRPYYHYQSLFHDPRIAAEGLAVAPSPLANGPEDALVRGHFQLRARGAAWEVTMPTINDDIPALSSDNLVADTALRGDLVAVAGRLAEAASGPALALPTLVATAEQPKPHTRHNPATPEVADSTAGAATGSASGAGSGSAVAAQVIELSPDEYAQNAYSNNAYQQALENRRTIDPDELVQQRRVQRPQQRAQAANPPDQADPPPQQRATPPTQAMTPPPQQGVTPPTQAATPPTQAVTPKPPPARRRPRDPAAARPPERVTIAIAPLEWHEASVGDRVELTALRRVDTPDGELTQGLIIDDRAVAAWLADRHPGARLTAAAEVARAETVAADIPIGGSWRVELPVDGFASASAAVAAVRSAFWGRFVPIAALAALCGLMVVVVVARAERFAAARSRFAAAAAHELRTPLAGLQLYGDMLADGLGDPTKTQQYAHRIAEEASRLGRVVANVLGFSQLERGDLAVHPRAGDAAAAARDVVERVRPSLERAGMTLEVELPESLPARLDPDAVARILGNLMDNAEKYSRGGDARRVTLRGRAAGDTVELAVTDSGPGVAAGARLFVPFSRGVGADGPAGLGLGLALSRSLARAMGGELAHTDGATFVLTLPAAPGPGSDAAGRS